MLVKIGKYIGFCVDRRSYQLCPPVIVLIVVPLWLPLFFFLYLTAARGIAFGRDGINQIVLLPGVVRVAATVLVLFAGAYIPVL